MFYPYPNTRNPFSKYNINSCFRVFSQPDPPPRAHLTYFLQIAAATPSLQGSNSLPPPPQPQVCLDRLPPPRGLLPTVFLQQPTSSTGHLGDECGLPPSLILGLGWLDECGPSVVQAAAGPTPARILLLLLPSPSSRSCMWRPTLKQGWSVITRIIMGCGYRSNGT
jgi:hypothetical protein